MGRAPVDLIFTFALCGTPAAENSAPYMSM